MKHKSKKLVSIFALCSLLFALYSCNGQQVQTLKSPDGNIEVTFGIKDSKPYYSVLKNGAEIIKPSALGFLLNENDNFCCDFIILGTENDSKDETWQQVWGEEIDVRNHYNELTIKLQEKGGKKRILNIVFRAFDDGVGFRYVFPEQENLKEFEIADELTEFNLAQDFDIWSQQSRDKDYETLFHKRKISEISDTVNTPVTIELADGGYALIHEAALIDYAAMNLYNPNAAGAGLQPVPESNGQGTDYKSAPAGATLKADLTPWSTGIKVYAKTPFSTPWRFVVLADNLNALANSRVMLNLNEPCKIEDTSWIKPTKYVGIWWGIHLGYQTWGPPSAKHGATTENMKKYIDFAAENGFDGVLAEGWNAGWDSGYVVHGERYKFAETYPDFEIEKISKYGAAKGVKVIGHNETGGATINYENQLDSAFKFANKYGIASIKTGYVHPLLDYKERHSSQYGIRHYRKVVETAAKYRVMIDCHEPAMPTGWQRTYPNLMAQEGVRGQEYDAWSDDGGNPPEHTTILPFTRNLAGPIDFTPGTFNFNNPAHNARVHTTIAKQLALYVVIYSPLVMASDMIENYKNRPEFEFIKIVPVDWQKTIILDGKIGDFVITARKDKNSENWYIGAITDENARDIKIDFSFLDKDKKYVAKIFKDGAKADYKTNPYPVEISEQEVDYQTVLDLHLATSGGAAIQLRIKN
ncbi:MAG: glycoside hydrolase family 97 protein [Prevotellaceae bacterium]|jgi:alpha-glucosidase|nr:glycoside hydrolase family 97 protein [Prevotellaceae bacterium]